VKTLNLESTFPVGKLT